MIDLISDKCWFCKNKFEIHDYNETFQCHQYDNIITLRLNIDETFLISFKCQITFGHKKNTITTEIDLLQNSINDVDDIINSYILYY